MITYDGSILHSLHFHLLYMTGGDLFGLGKEIKYFDLWNINDPHSQAMLSSFKPYVYRKDKLVNILDQSINVFDGLDERQKKALVNAFRFKWFYGSSADGHEKHNDKLLGVFPWNAKVLKDVDGNDVWAHEYGSDVLRIYDPLGPQSLIMKLQTVAVIGTATYGTYWLAKKYKVF